MINYLPLNVRWVDSQYQDTLKLIWFYGHEAKSMHTESSFSYLAIPPMRFDLSNGVPFINERDVSGFWKSAINELFAFINGMRTQQGLLEYGVSSRFWGDTVTKEKCEMFGLEAGDLGDGSYGPGFVGRVSKDGHIINQVQNVLEQIKKNPHSRTHFIDPWMPEYTVPGPNNERKVVVAPCHGWMHFRLIGGRLNLHMFQRAGDVPVGVPSNMIQYSAFLIAVAHCLDLEVGSYFHSISDAHYYSNQTMAVNALISREPRKLPRLDLVDNAPKDIFAFRAEHFILSEYNPHEPIKNIPVSV